MQSKNFLSIVVFCLLVVGGIGYYVFKDVSSQKEGGIVKDMLQEAENNQENKDEVGNGDVAVEIVEVGGGSVVSEKLLIPVPNLDRMIKIPENTPPEVSKRTTTEINRILGMLKQDSNLFNEWSDLGLIMKSIDDYVWARDSWEYAAALRPNDSLAFTNLGNLYGYYLKEPVKAEKNYLKSIEIEPKLPYLYVRTAFFYLEALNDKEKARNIIEKGLKAVPGDDELEETLAETNRF